MSSKAYFTDDTVYSASDVNQLLSYIFGSGVVAFTELPDQNTLENLNDITSQIVQSGITAVQSCKVISTNGGYVVSQGVCVLPTGAVLTIDADGLNIEVPNGQASYVYAEHNTLLNNVSVVVSQEAPSDETTVILAEIDADGNVTDRRSLAKSNISIFSGHNIKMTMSGTIQRNQEIIIKLPYTGFNYAECLNDDSGPYVSAYKTTPTSSYKTIWKFGAEVTLKLKIVGNELYLKYDGNSMNYEIELT